MPAEENRQAVWTNDLLSSHTSHLHKNAVLFFYCCVTNYHTLNSLAIHNYLVFHGLEVQAWLCYLGSHKAKIKVSAS